MQLLVYYFFLFTPIKTALLYSTSSFFVRHRLRSGKGAVVELTNMADNDSVDSKEKQDADTSVDNVCYDKILSKQKRDAAVELDDMVDKGDPDSKVEQNTSVDNICYEKISSKLN